MITITQETAERLTSLFQKSAEDRALDFRTVRLCVDTEERSEITFSNMSPHGTAQYLKNLLNTQNPLFKRLTLDNGMPAPIVLLINGRYRHETLDKEYALEPALIIRFMDENMASDITVNYDTYWSPSEERQKNFSGPTIHQFIRTLEKAGLDWSQVSFTETPPKKPGPLKLVK